MTEEIRAVQFDPALQIEAYHFKGIMQQFPNHFHEYYVIGFIEKGIRHLSCKNNTYIVQTGDIIIFNPYDTHTCKQLDEGTLDYRCINIQPQVMQKIVFEITGQSEQPYFTTHLISQTCLIFSLSELHQQIMRQEKDFKKEELFLFLMKQLIDDYTLLAPFAETSELNTQIKNVCTFLEKHCTENITLADLSQQVGLSKYYLLRSFTKQKGISPYNYLTTLRIDKSKKLLEQGVPPIEVAIQTGFSDQSHFTNSFKKYIGLTPKQYMKTFLNCADEQHVQHKEIIREK